MLDFNFFYEDYVETQNPRFVWQALRYYLGGPTPLPEWIQDYLKETADRILEIDQDTKGVKNGLFRRALGVNDVRVFKRKSVFYEEYRLYNEVVDIYEELKRVHDKRRVGLDEAFDLCSERRYACREYVRKIYYKINALICAAEQHC